MRKLMASLCALVALVVGFALFAPETVRAVTPNTPCHITQGGDFFVAAAGCTIDATAGVTLIGSGANPPTGSCTPGELFLDTDETSDTYCTTDTDNSLCKCVATDTWAGDRFTLRAGPSAPSSCTVGELFLDTDETNDTNCTTTDDNSICACVATNTWSSTE